MDVSVKIVPFQPFQFFLGLMTYRIVGTTWIPFLVDVVNPGLEEIEPRQVHLAIEGRYFKDAGESRRGDMPVQQVKVLHEPWAGRDIGIAKPEILSQLVDIAKVGSQLTQFVVPCRLNGFVVRAFAHAQLDPVFTKFAFLLANRGTEERVKNIRPLSSPVFKTVGFVIIDADNQIVRVNEAFFVLQNLWRGAYNRHRLSLEPSAGFLKRDETHPFLFQYGR